MVHIAVAGTGRVGSEIAFSLVFERYVTRLSLVDVAPEVAQMTKEELYHAAASHGFNTAINAYEKDDRIQNADLIVIAASYPRTPQMNRRDLATENSGIVKQIVQETLYDNPAAWYLVITDPVDAMATLANKVAGGKRPVIGVGTNLETARFRTILSRELKVPIGAVEAYVGGEHGDAAVALWSTVNIDGLTLEEWLKEKGKTIDRVAYEYYMKETDKEILQVLGGARYGPAGAFIEIIRGIMLNTGKVISYARPRTFDSLPEPVYVTIPARIAKSLGPDMWNLLAKKEQRAIKEAARIIYSAYSEAQGREEPDAETRGERL